MYMFTVVNWVNWTLDKFSISLGAGKMWYHINWGMCKWFPAHPFCIPLPWWSTACVCTVTGHSGPDFHRNPGTQSRSQQDQVSDVDNQDTRSTELPSVCSTEFLLSHLWHYLNPHRSWLDFLEWPGAETTAQIWKKGLYSHTNYQWCVVLSTFCLICRVISQSKVWSTFCIPLKGLFHYRNSHCHISVPWMLTLLHCSSWSFQCWECAKDSNTHAHYNSCLRNPDLPGP